MYPKTLLPQLNYRQKISIDCLLDHGEMFLMRRMDDDEDSIYDSVFGDWNVTVFPYKEIPNMSLNLLCSLCPPNSSGYVATGIGKQDWDGIKILSDEEIKVNHKMISPFSNVFVSMSRLHNLPFTITYPADSGTKKNLTKRKIINLTESINKSGAAILLGQGTLKLAHSPSNLNYWHFHLECHAENKVVDRNNFNKTIKTALIALEQKLSFGSINGPVLPYPNPQICYIKEAS